MDTLNFLVQALIASAATIVVALAGPLFTISLRERRHREPLKPWAVIGAGVVGSWVFPGALFLLLYVAEALGFEPLGTGEPLAPPTIRVVWTGFILTLLGAAVGAAVLMVRGIRRRRLAH